MNRQPSLIWEPLVRSLLFFVFPFLVPQLSPSTCTLPSSFLLLLLVPLDLACIFLVFGPWLSINVFSRGSSPLLLFQKKNNWVTQTIMEPNQVCRGGVELDHPKSSLKATYQIIDYSRSAKRAGRQFFAFSPTIASIFA